MARKPGEFERFGGRSTDADADSPDIRVASHSRWLLGAMVLASSIGLLATSDVRGPQFQFQTTIDGPSATLSQAAPSARFLVTIHVDALGPAHSDTTTRANAQVRGSIIATEAPTGASPFVEAQVTGRANAGSPPLSALTQFDLGQPLSFSGDCANPSPLTPCQAAFVLELTRDDGGTRGGVLRVDWAVTFEGSAKKDSGTDEGPSPPPWTIEVSAQ